MSITSAHVQAALKRMIWFLPFISFLAGYFLLSTLYTQEPFQTPSLIGKDLHNAISILSSCNLNPRLQATKEVIELPHGTILSQVPAAGTSIKPNQNVYLVTSTKPNLQVVPNLINRPLSEVTPLLNAAGIGNKIYYLQSNYPQNTCIGHYPAAGQSLKENKIIVYASSGNKKPIILPNFKGQPVPTVLEQIKEYPIKVSCSHNSPQDPHHVCNNACIITDQRPLPGSLITLNDQKPLVLNVQISS